jgi:hypothetical protein
VARLLEALEEIKEDGVVCYKALVALEGEIYVEATISTTIP